MLKKYLYNEIQLLVVYLLGPLKLPKMFTEQKYDPCKVQMSTSDGVYDLEHDLPSSQPVIMPKAPPPFQLQQLPI